MSMLQQRGYADNGNEPNYNGPYLIRIRGLPWSTTKQDILDFFDGVHILSGEDGIHLITLPMLPSRPLGEAYIQLASERDLELAHTFDRKNLGSRYIEVFNAHVEDFQNTISKQQHVDEECVLRLRGLPWNATKMDIANFFRGLELNTETDIHIHYDRDGRVSGEAYVQFRTIDDCQEALKLNMEKLGHRYIEIFTSTAQQLRRSMMQTNQVQGEQRSRNYTNDNRSMDNDSGGNFGPMRDKRINRNNVRKPYSNNDLPGFRNRGFSGFSNLDRNNFDDRRGNGNIDFSNNRRGFRNEQANDQFASNNCDRFNNSRSPRDLFNFNGNGSNVRQSDQSFGLNRDFGGTSRFSDNSSVSFRSNFNGNARGGNGNDIDDNCREHLVLARGMPFCCDEMDIYKFFDPIKPAHCEVILNDKGQHTGQAKVYFNSREDVSHAMQMNREKMGSRYIELFDVNDNRRRRF